MRIFLQTLLWLAWPVGLWLSLPFLFFYIPLMGVSAFGERGGAFVTVAVLIVWLEVLAMGTTNRKYPPKFKL
jgi:hypothetical protein